MLFGRRSPSEHAALGRAKARLDRLAYYPRPVRTGNVRILHAPWLFAIPGLRGFVGYEFGPLIFLRRPLEESSDDLVVHELCHVWQSQNDHARMWLSYLYLGYPHNPYEVMARRAAALTRDAPG